MRIEFEYLKNLLDAVLDNEHPDFTLNQDGIKPLWTGGDEKLHKFIFHMEILEDQGLVESSTGSSGIGFTRMGNGSFSVSIKPLRLTAQGHQFASDLSKPSVLEKLQASFSDAGPSEAVKIVFALGKIILEKRLDGLLD